MQLSQSERIARKELFAQIEAALLPDAATRINAIDPFDVESVMFGSKPTQKAYGVDGDLRFELGRWDDGVFVPFGARLLHPFRPPDLDVAYPKETSFLWRNMFSHYTPITRRLDYFEVWTISPPRGLQMWMCERRLLDYSLRGLQRSIRQRR